MRRIVRAALVLVLGLGLTGVAAGQGALSKRHAAGLVAVTVSLLERPVAGASLKVKVGLDTHSMGLDAIRFETAVLVRAADGSEQPPSAVERATGGGHHREAVLVFAAPDRSGPVTIVVKDVGGVAMRNFVWEVAAGK